jgi:hypothetical protein
MHWKKLVEGATLFRRHGRGNLDYDRYWADRDQGQRLTGCELNSQEAVSLITFINRWSTRSPLKPGELSRGYASIHPLLSTLDGVKFETLEFKAPIGTNGLTVQSAIAQIFDGIAGCGQRFESTGASKILHALRPDLFVMWDERIASGYGVSPSRRKGTEYAGLFLPRIRGELDQAIESLSVGSGIDRHLAIESLKARAGVESVSKMLDEYNYMKFTIGVPTLW